MSKVNIHDFSPLILLPLFFILILHSLSSRALAYIAVNVTPAEHHVGTTVNEILVREEELLVLGLWGSRDGVMHVLVLIHHEVECVCFTAFFTDDVLKDSIVTLPG